MSQTEGAGQRTTDVDTAEYVVEQPDAYYVEGLENGTLLANGSDGNSRQDKQPLVPVQEPAGETAEDDVNLVVVPSDEVHVPEQEAFIVEPESGQGTDLRVRPTETAPALTSKNEGVPGYDRGVRVLGTHVEAETFEARYARNGRGGPSDVVPPLKAQSGETGKGDGAPLVAAFSKTHGAQDTDDHEMWDEAGVSRSLNSMGYATDMAVELHAEGREGESVSPSETREGWGSAAVRRLTPTECERLQAFPDGWTAIDGDATPDGPRYAALGDAVTVSVAWWVVSRLRKKFELERTEASDGLSTGHDYERGTR